jgi:hypothetical protein
MDVLKRRLIEFMIKDIKTNANFNLIFTQCQTIVKNSFKNLDSLTDKNINLETLLIITKVLDKMFINISKSAIYLQSVSYLKEKLLDNTQRPNFANYQTAISGFLDKIIERSNVSLKLDKKINDLVLIIINKQLSNTHLIHDNKLILINSECIKKE